MPETVLPHLSARVLGLARLGLMVLDANQLHRHVEPVAGQPLGPCRRTGCWSMTGCSTLFPELRGQRLEQAVQSAMQSKLPQQLSPALNRSPFPLVSRTGSWGGARVEQAVSVTPFTEGKERFCLIEVSDISTTVGRERQLRGAGRSAARAIVCRRPDRHRQPPPL
jgi:hypothetical protein